MIDELQTKCISDVFDKLYNTVMEKFVLFKHRSNIPLLLEIANHLITKKSKINYYNQIEILVQAYLLKEQTQKSVFLDYITRINYSLDANVFNFVLNLVLDSLDFDTAISMFEMVFESKL